MKIRILLYIIPAILLLASCKTASVESSSKSTAEAKQTDKDLQARALFHDAMKEILIGNYGLAENLFQQCLAIDPGNAAAHYELGRIHYHNNKISEAVKEAEMAAELRKDIVWYRLFLGEIYEQAGRSDDASSVYRALTKDFPDNDDYFQLLANSYILGGKFTDAIRVYDEIEGKTGVSEEISLQKQKIYLSQGKADKAMEEIEKLAAAFPEEMRYMAMLAEMYMTLGEEEKAYEVYQKILETDPGDPYIRMSLADYYRKKGDNDKSFEEMKKGFENPRLDIDTKVTILLSYYSVTEKFDELKPQAYELSDILVKTHPEEAKAYSVRADFLARDQKYPEAREDLLKVISLDSSRYLVWELLLRMDVELEDVEAMGSHSKRAIAMFPMQPMPHLFSGLSMFQQDKFEEAAKSFERGSKLVVDNRELQANFQMYLGDTYYQLKETEKAFKAYENVLKINPDNAYVLNNYSYYLSTRNEKLEKAAGMAKRANELSPGNSSYEDTYAWVLYKQGYYKEAREWMDKALSHEKENNAVLLEHYGDILYKLGDTEGAYKYWVEALEAGEGSEFLKKKVEDKKLYE